VTKSTPKMSNQDKRTKLISSLTEQVVKLTSTEIINRLSPIMEEFTIEELNSFQERVTKLFLIKTKLSISGIKLYYSIKFLIFKERIRNLI
jgi:hypothetical protein